MSDETQQPLQETAAAGMFWVQGGNETPGTVEYTENNEYVLRLSVFCFPPVQVTILDDGAIQYSNEPDHIAADFSARTIFGRLSDGQLVTFLDANMRPGTDFTTHTLQWFTGKQRIHGAHAKGEAADVAAIRWSWPIPSSVVNWTGEADVSGAVPGSIGPWTHEGNAGLTFTAAQPSTLGTLIHDIQSSSAQLLGLWTQKEPPNPLVTELFLKNAWCLYVPRGDQKHDSVRTSALLPLKDLRIGHLAAWLPLAETIDPFPYVANSRSGVIQVEAQMLVTALEGLHRRLHADQRPFKALSMGAVLRAMKEAREVGVQALMDAGLDDEESARRLLRDALNHVDQPTYHERIVQLASPVREIAPGICGPDLEQWVAIVKKIRNDQSHQLVEKFGGTELSSYFVATISCRWILTLRILLELMPPEDLKTAVRKSQYFMFALANMDEEHLWNSPGALDVFRAKNDTT